MYYEPDDIWRMFNIHNLEEYIHKYVVKGCFHSKVSKDVIESYKTVEYLMAHAYYHWPMYDEALKHLLGIFEMSVSQECKKQKIRITYKNKDGKTVNKKLNTLIDQLVKRKQLGNIKDVIHNIRKLRNYYSHPKGLSFQGGIALNSIYFIVNFINLLSLPIDWHKRQRSELNKVRNQFRAIENRLYKVHYENQDILVHKIKPVYVAQIDGNWWHIWVFIPVLINTREVLTTPKHVEPIVFILRDESLTEEGLLGINLETGSEVKICFTDKAENKSLLKQYLEEYNAVADEYKLMYNNSLGKQIDRQVTKFLYNYCWQNN